MNRGATVGSRRLTIGVAIAWSLPVVFAADYVLHRYVLFNAAAPELIRPMVFCAALALLLLLVSGIILANKSWAPLTASLCFLVLAADPVPAMVVAALSAWWVMVGFLRRRGGKATPPLQVHDLPTRLATWYAVSLLAAGIWLAFVAQPTIIDPPRFEVAGGERGGPDIYLLLLDGYARADTMRDAFGIDNAPFERELEGLGFEFADSARSNYNKTWLTVASMLNAGYVHEMPPIADPPEDAPRQTRLMHTLIDKAAILDMLRERGYKVVSIPSQIGSTDVFREADVMTSGHLTGLETSLLSTSLIAALAPRQTLELMADDQRAYAFRQFELLRQQAAPEPGTPRLVLTHLLPPHPPFLLDQFPEYLTACFPRFCKLWETTIEETRLDPDAYAEHMARQVRVLNDLVLGAVSTIVKSNPTAVIIVYSDHGARHVMDDLDEHFRIMFASRTPGRDHVFPNDIGLVNVFPRLLSAYEMANLPEHDYAAWESAWFRPLELTPHLP